ncbi:sugar ABC transporter substrate-binding protein [Fodinisporobacter ferrooxydans]|uniref:Sugar ABC transporter substrate-binding protein n=1 Tax=Fodinisporobacter ferrooxydans TaxID=2901836 RepID=A0ABY4CDW9_9BACL|nr:sugar ABC transporter substrate-binding protein [Alicyclobacillaceae bacterium MYW30-H2]
MKKTVLGISAVLATSLLATACGSSSSSTAASGGNSSSAGSETITVASWNDAADSLKAEIAGFNKKYPNIKVNIQYVDTNYTKIMPELASGSNVPDIIQTQNRDFPAFMKKFPGEFVDITNQTKDLKDKFVASAWEPVTGSDGKIYAMPWDLGPAAVYYRKDMFQQAGVDPNSIKTWDDFIKAGKRVEAKFPGVKMEGYQEANFDPYEIFLNELAGNYVTSGGKIDITSSQSKQALSLLQKMHKAGLLLDVKDWNGQITAINNNKLASIIYPVWYAGTLMNSVKDQSGKWGIMPLPAFTAGGNNQANLGGSVLAITKQSKHPDAAWKFIQYSLATDEGESVMLKYGLFPSYTPFYSNAEFKKTNDYFGTPIYNFFASQTKNIPPLNHGPIMLDASKPLGDMEAAVLSGTSPDQATQTAAEAISKSTGLPLK